MLLVTLYYGLAFYEGATMALNKPKISVAESSGVCYTLLACGDGSRNRLLCAFDGATVVDCVEVQSITTYTASLICTL